MRALVDHDTVPHISPKPGNLSDWRDSCHEPAKVFLNVGRPKRGVVPILGDQSDVCGRLGVCLLKCENVPVLIAAQSSRGGA